MSVLVNQQGASAHGDIVARDKHETHYHAAPQKAGIVEALLQKLQIEIEKNEKVRHTVEALAHFGQRAAHDGINGLEAKLQAGNRSDEYFDALQKKELFAKLLERWSLYASAQEIFAYLLAKAEHEFTYFIRPEIESRSKTDINQLVSSKIVEPIITECGANIFTINHATAMGMIYWLAEQCFVRWHK